MNGQKTNRQREISKGVEFAFHGRRSQGFCISKGGIYLTIRSAPVYINVTLGVPRNFGLMLGMSRSMHLVPVDRPKKYLF